LIISLAIYTTLAILVAWAGRKSRIGFAGVFVLSFVITPPIAALVLLLVSPASAR